MHLLARILAVAGLAFTMGAARGQVSEVARRGHSLSRELDAMNVERLWLSGRDVDEKTGATRKTPDIKDGSLTHSGAFVAAACARLGVDLPRPGARTEADVSDWLGAEGRSHGWKSIKDPIEAQKRANAGEVVVAAFKAADPAGGGHVALVRPSTKTKRAVREEGPQVIQAGLENFRSTSLKTGFRHHPEAWPRGVQFFAHEWPAPPRLAKGTIDARQAVAIAERFVRENGYTDFVPDDLRCLVPESIEFSREPRNWLKGRHNQLKPQAVGFRKGSRNDREGWTVGFELVDPTNVTPATGRAVTMDAKRAPHQG